MKRAHCRLGHVKLPGRTNGRIVAQHPKPGKTLPAGRKVAVTLG